MKIIDERETREKKNEDGKEQRGTDALVKG